VSSNGLDCLKPFSTDMGSVNTDKRIRKHNYFQKTAKKQIIINIYQYICEINFCNKQKNIQFLFLVNKVIIAFVNCLKKNFLLYNYYMFSLLFSVKIQQLHRQNLLIITYLRYSFNYGRAFTKICLISRPSRKIYLHFEKIIKIISFNRSLNKILYLIYCVYGLVSNIELRLLRVGGEFFCLIK
jgi:ribosomal protein S8